MRIELENLRAAAELLFAHLEEMGHDSLDISHDYYWDIMPPERYDPYKKPVAELALGQLTHDWENLERFLRHETDPIGYGLVWLSALLRVVGEEVIG